MVVTAKSNDQCIIDLDGEKFRGYMLSTINCGAGDYTGFSVCADCGQMDGTWPLTRKAHLIDEDEQNEKCLRGTPYGINPKHGFLFPTIPDSIRKCSHSPIDTETSTEASPQPQINQPISLIVTTLQPPSANNNILHVINSADNIADDPILMVTQISRGSVPQIPIPQVSLPQTSVPQIPIPHILST
jgi:hypothetical protein